MKRPLLGISLSIALAACAASNNTNNTVVNMPPITVAAAPDAGPPPPPAEEPDPYPLTAPPPRPDTPDAPFRAQAPAAGTTAPFAPPRISQFRLRNGLSVLLVERHELPVITAQYVTNRGGDDQAPANAGLASLTGSLLDLGTTTRDALALSDAYETIGAEHGSAAGWDSGVVFVKVLANQFPAALELFADEVRNPAFSPEEIERARRRRLAAIRAEVDSPRVVAGNVLARVLFGDSHPYSRSLVGTEQTVTAITREAVQQYYASHFGPTSGAIVVSGDITQAALRPLLERHFGTWTVARPAAQPPVPNAQNNAATSITLVDNPRAPQSAVVVAHAGVPRRSPDYVPLVVMNAILGGMFSSRINMNLREQHAYTYGAGSNFAFRRGAGPFSVGGAVHTPSTGPAIREIFIELRRMRDTDVTAEELEGAKARIIDSLPARFETNEATAGAVAELFVYGLPLTEYNTLAQRIRAVSARDVRRVATRYLTPDRARIVVVGDRSVVEPQLRELQMGTVEVRQQNGDPVATP